LLPEPRKAKNYFIVPNDLFIVEGKEDLTAHLLGMIVANYI
jgi:hypothetical protein